MEIRKYKKADEDLLMKLIEAEGEDWECYSRAEHAGKYRRALENSVTYVAYQDNVLCGYSRSGIDGDFYIYVYDLLVMPTFRSQGIGRQLLECISKDYPEQTIYVMSGVDEYYSKLGYQREGSIFLVSGGTVEK
jgi:ribosomal protein S18 acetylase RimI-like enzyme